MMAHVGYRPSGLDSKTPIQHNKEVPKVKQENQTWTNFS
jgi:hypothetical protein